MALPKMVRSGNTTIIDTTPLTRKESALKGELVVKRFSEFQYESPPRDEDNLEDNGITKIDERDEDNYEEEDLEEDDGCKSAADLQELMIQLDLSAMKLAVEAFILDMDEIDDRERASCAPNLDQPLPLSTDVTVSQVSQYFSVIDIACRNAYKGPKFEEEAIKWAQKIIPAWWPCFATRSTNFELLSTISNLIAQLLILDYILRKRSAFLSDEQHDGLVKNMAQFVSNHSPSKWISDLDLKLCSSSLLVMAELLFDSNPRDVEKETKVIRDNIQPIASCCFPHSARFLHRSLNSAFKVLSLALRRYKPCIGKLVAIFASEGVFLSASLHSNILQDFYPRWLLFNAEKSVDTIKMHCRTAKESLLGLLPTQTMGDLNSSLVGEDDHYVTDSWFSCYFTLPASEAFLSTIKLVLPLQDAAIPKNCFRARHRQFLVQEISSRSKHTIHERLETYLWEQSSFKVADRAETAPISASYAMLLRVGIEPRSAIAIIRMLSQYSESNSWSFDKLFSLADHLVIQSAMQGQLGGLLRNSYNKKHQILRLLGEPQGWWKSVALWQAESTMRLEEDHLSLAFAVSAASRISNWNFPKWLMESACYQPYPSIENLLYMIDPEQMLKPHWEVDGKRYEIRTTERFRDFVVPGAQSLPPYQSFHWICLPQHNIEYQLEADSVVELGAKLQQVLGASSSLDESSLRCCSFPATVHSDLCSRKLLGDLLLRYDNVRSVRFHLPDETMGIKKKYKYLPLDPLLQGDSFFSVVDDVPYKRQCATRPSIHTGEVGTR